MLRLKELSQLIDLTTTRIKQILKEKADAIDDFNDKIKLYRSCILLLTQKENQTQKDHEEIAQLYCLMARTYKQNGFANMEQILYKNALQILKQSCHNENLKKTAIYRFCLKKTLSR